MRLQPFEMERWQSTWEHRVKYNLSESGVHPLSVSELLDDNPSILLNQSLEYVQTNGTEELRKTVASLYPGAGPEDILVTNGSSEANFIVLWSFLEPGAEIAIMLPNYMQIWGLAKTMQTRVRSFWLGEKKGHWEPDLRGLRKIVNKRTKLIAICNPNNPTGAVFREKVIDEICEIASKVGAWILSDEVYQGSELDGKTAPTIWGRYRKSIVTNGLSKAYGLPGLRIGWIASDAEIASKLWSYHDYTTIGPSALGDLLARHALQPERRSKILQRTRGILRTNLQILKDWIRRYGRFFSFIAPEAGAIAYLKYSMKINSTELAERLLKEKSTLIVPGRHFGMRNYLRIGYGGPQDYLIAGMSRIGEFVDEQIGK